MNGDKIKNEKSNPHKDHRKRLRSRFLNEGMYHFEDHQILEMLLFYAIPRMDTNELGHRLLKRFHSLAGVFNAEYLDLLSVEGMGENSACLIRMIPQLARAYMLSEAEEKKHFRSLHEIGIFLQKYYIGETRETAVGLYLNSQMDLLHIERFVSGTDTETSVSGRKVLDLMLRTNAKYFVLAHNHPDGILTVSEEDRVLTSKLSTLLAGIETTFLEHYIVTHDDVRMVLHPNLQLERPSYFRQDGDSDTQGEKV